METEAERLRRRQLSVARRLREREVGILLVGSVRRRRTSMRMEMVRSLQSRRRRWSRRRRAARRLRALDACFERLLTT